MPMVMNTPMFKRQEGFTLIELLAVMAIVGTLAAVVSASVVGIGTESRDATTQQDATTTSTTAGEYFADQKTPTLLDTQVVLTTRIDGGTPNVPGEVQTINTAWPESPITTSYPTEFSTLDPTPVANVVIRLSDLSTVLTEFDLLTGYTAVSFSKLQSGGYSKKVPASATQTRTLSLPGSDVAVHSYLWLFQKSTGAGGATDNSRTVAVFKLSNVAIDGAAASLEYEQIF